MRRLVVRDKIDTERIIRISTCRMLTAVNISFVRTLAAAGFTGWLDVSSRKTEGELPRLGAGFAFQTTVAASAF